MQYKALLFATSLLVPSFSWAAIDVNSQLSMQGGNIKLTIPGNNPGGNIRFYIDMDNNPETGSTSQESGLKGADYYIENDILYSATGNTWEYVSNDIISFSNDKDNLELNVNSSTFETLANSASLLNSENNFEGFDGTVKMNVVTLDYKWNVIDTSGPTEYNILDIEIPAAAEEQPATTNTKPKPAKSANKESAKKKPTETKRQRQKRLKQERKRAQRLKSQARKKLRQAKKQKARQKRREQRLAAARKKSKRKNN